MRMVAFSTARDSVAPDPQGLAGGQRAV